jgi:hypothetical protein
MPSILVPPAVNPVTVVLKTVILTIPVPTSLILRLPMAYLLLFAPCDRPGPARLKRARSPAEKMAIHRAPSQQLGLIRELND